ncbi:2150_t:CDS:10 [Ambispora gerdemannii]|uniref:2150_t:CDS:1 n=1 Tax=Ambispora gerdemannii TaxID=144530 RepID=A0A9N8YTM0_9GLOM|nr:2150_t:CDS:10 [Ambispora gerdemannii]
MSRYNMDIDMNLNLTNNNNNTFRIQHYANQFTTYLQNENYDLLAKLLSINGEHSKNLARALDSGIARYEDVQYNFTKPWSDIIASHFKVLLSYYRREYINAFNAQLALVNLFSREAFTNSNLHIFYVMNWDLRKVAIEADKELRQSGQKPKYLEETGRVLNKSFSICVTDRAPKNASRQWGTYYIANLLIKTHHKLGHENLCKNVLRGVNSADLPPLEAYPKAHQITFKYYNGLLCFADQQYAQSEEFLKGAFRICPISYTRNKELILRYLIPVWMIRGVLPTNTLIDRYPRLKLLYSPFINAIRTGNVKAFDLAFANAEHILIEHGTYLTIEKARMVSVKNLFKKVWIHNNEVSKLPMSQFSAALRFAGIDADMAEVAWTLSVMIHKGFIKGYLSQSKLMVVLSTKEPFPSQVNV